MLFLDCVVSGKSDNEEALPEGEEGSRVARLNFKTSRVGVYKCLSLIVGFAVTVAIWPRGAVSCRDFILRAVATFWAMSLVGIYPGRASMNRTFLIKGSIFVQWWLSEVANIILSFLNRH